MKRAAPLLALALLAQAAPAGSAVPGRFRVAPAGVAASPIAGRVLVADDAGVFRLEADGRLRSGPARAAAILQRHALTRAIPLGHGRTSATRFLALESSAPGFDPVAVAAELRASGLVRAAVPDRRIQLHVLPNDPHMGSQWWVDDGSFADVRLPAAWDVEKGSASARIGVMDTGVDMGHPDLAAKIWTNPGEIAANSIDDDGNGYVDDIHGWDFGDGDNDPNPHAVPDPATFDLDIGFHGTFVAGIAGAATNNAEGIAGAGWNCPVVPLKVVNQAADITLSAMTEAFAYAATMHLEVLNMSLGTAEEPGVEAYFQALVDDAIAAGVLCVASAGNSGTDEKNFPAACSGVVSVAATNAANERAAFSNFGPTVRIAAPGETMWSALCRNYELDEFSQLFYEVFFGWDSFSPYMGGDGTSFSAPLVAGVAGLVRSRHPSWPPQVVASHLVATGDAVAYDEPIGPRLNAYRAVTEAPLAVGAAPLVAGAFHVAPNPSFAEAVFRFDLPAGGAARVRILDCAGRVVRELAGSGLTPGANSLRWDGADAAGRASPPGLYVVQLETAAGRRSAKLLRVR